MGFLRSPGPIQWAIGSHEVWSVPPGLFCWRGLAEGKSRPKAKRLSWQAQGGRVKSLAVLNILRAIQNPCEVSGCSIFLG